MIIGDRLLRADEGTGEVEPREDFEEGVPGSS
jgi:hypothetical protein